MQSYSLGRSVALISTSICHIDTAYPYFHFLWFGPFQIAFVMYMIYYIIGSPTFWIVVLLLSAIPLQLLIVHHMNIKRKRVYQLTDRRLKFLQDTIIGIKVIKYFAWEPVFIKRLGEYRKEELLEIRGLMLLASWSVALNVAVPAFAGVIGYILWSWDGRRMEASIVFPMLTYFNMLDLPLYNVPLMATFSVDAFAALSRIQDFLRTHSVKPLPVSDANAPDAILIQDGEFHWTNSQTNGQAPLTREVVVESKAVDASMSELQIPIDRLISVSPSTTYDVPGHTWCHEMKPFEGLKDINLQIPRGKLVAVVGPVGSGKSSLLAALFGEMEQQGGRMTLASTVGYCPQQPWIINGSVRENILVGQEFEDLRYWQAVRECQMEEDLVSLPFGDMTDIGEGGISLSGGQKARINLARMVYFTRQIVLMDDPLSAVDNRVGRSIFEKCIVEGSLKDRTRVLVTHHLGILPYCDYVVVMRHGVIAEQGTYGELLSRSGSFALLLKRYNQDHQAQTMAEQDQLGHNLASLSEEKRCLTPVEKMSCADASQQKTWRQEELQAKSVSFRAYTVYILAAGGLAFIFLAITIMTLSETLRTGRDVWLAWWVELKDGFGLGLSHEGFRNYYILFAVLQTILTCFCGLLFIQAGHYASKQIHDMAFHRIMQSPVRFFDSTSVGRIINRFGRDLDMIDGKVSEDLWYLLFAFGSILSTLVVMFVWEPMATPAFIVPVILIIFLQAIYRSGALQLQRLYAACFSPLMSNFSETYLGLAVAHAFRHEDYFRRKHFASTNLISQCMYATAALRRWTSVYCEFISATLISVSGLSCFLLKTSAEATGLILTSLVNFVFSLDWFIKQFADLEASMISVERLYQYAADLEPESTQVAALTPEPSWPSSGRVEIRNLYLSYRSGTQPVLNDLCLSIEPGERVAVVGRTGAGKSSIMAAMMRTVECSSGTILVDEVNIRDLSLETLRSRLTIVPQDPVLFAETLRFNLDPTGVRSDDEIWRALESVGLLGTVTGLANKLDYQVCDFGENFSLGQRQLFCLARALLRRSKVVLMDEATASMDVETDAMIQYSIRKNFQDCTIITIAHRLGTVRDYSRILVMSAGRIIEAGTPDALLSDPHSELSSLFRSSLASKSAGQ